MEHATSTYSSPPLGEWRTPVWASALGWFVAGPGATVLAFVYLTRLEESVDHALGLDVLTGDSSMAYLALFPIFILFMVPIGPLLGWLMHRSLQKTKARSAHLLTFGLGACALVGLPTASCVGTPGLLYGVIAGMATAVGRAVALAPARWDSTQPDPAGSTDASARPADM